MIRLIRRYFSARRSDDRLADLFAELRRRSAPPHTGRTPTIEDRRRDTGGVVHDPPTVGGEEYRCHISDVYLQERDGR